jgi:hypothetical protein
MGRALLTTIAVAAAVLAHGSTASAGGWAGSRYVKTDCIYEPDADLLYSDAWFTEETFTSLQMTVPDLTCDSTLRLVVRTGWIATTYHGWSVYSGRVPVRHLEILGNEESFEVSWHDYGDEDQGCVRSGELRRN